MMKVTHIDIAKDFSPTLGPRRRQDGKWSGEEFRQENLEPAFLSSDLVVVHLDRIRGFSASFFEEAFGGLVREYGYEKVAAKIRFAAIERAYLLPKLETWMKEASVAA